MTAFRLDDLPVGLLLVLRCVTLSAVGFGIVARLAAGLRRDRRPGAVASSGFRRGLATAGVVATAVVWLVVLRILSFPLTVRYFFALDDGQVAAVRVAVTRKDQAGWRRGGPEFAPVGEVVLTGPTEVAAVVGLMGKSAPYVWDHEGGVGRRYELSFRRADGTWLAETVTVLPATTRNASRYAIWFGRGSSVVSGGMTDSYTNPALGRWLEAAVAGRVPGEP